MSHSWENWSSEAICNYLDYLFWIDANHEANKQNLTPGARTEWWWPRLAREVWHGLPYVISGLAELKKREFNYVYPYDDRRLRPKW